MPETTGIRSRCGTWHGDESFRYRRGRENQTPDRFFTQRQINNDINHFFGEVVVQALQEREQLKIEDIWNYVQQRHPNLTRNAHWRVYVTDVLSENPDIEIDQDKFYYLKTDAIMTLSLTREQLESLNTGNSCLVLLPQEPAAQSPIRRNSSVSTFQNYDDDVYINNEDNHNFAMS